MSNALQGYSEMAQVMFCMGNHVNREILDDWLAEEFQIVSCDIDDVKLLHVDLILTDLMNLRHMHTRLEAARARAHESEWQTVPVILLVRTKRIPALDDQLLQYVMETVTIPTTKMRLKSVMLRTLSKLQPPASLMKQDALDALVAALGAKLDVGETTRTVLQYIGEAMPFEFQNMVVVRNGVAQLAAHSGYPHAADTFKDWQVAVENIPEPYRGALFHKQPITNRSGVKWDDRVVPMLKGARTFLIVPVRTEDALLGFITLGNRSRTANPEQYISQLTDLVAEIAPAIDNAIRHENARATAVIEERQRLARELHDSVTQTLFSASIIAESIPRKWAFAPPEATSLLQELHQLTRGALAETRMLLLEMRPNAIQQISFDELLQQLGEGVWSRKQIRITFKIEAHSGLDTDDKIALYRIAQEALNNVVKHADATEVSVRFRYADRIVMEIADNGQGFNTMMLTDGGMGLHIMQERAEAIEANLTIYSDDTGTRVIVEK